MFNHKIQPLIDFAMWSFLQSGHQEANIPALKEAVNELVSITKQKTAGQRENSKDISFDNIDRIQFTILCEAVALVLSGRLDELENNTENEE